MDLDLKIYLTTMEVFYAGKNPKANKEVCEHELSPAERSMFQEAKETEW